MDLLQRLAKDVSAEVGTFMMIHKNDKSVSYGPMIDYVVGQLRGSYQSSQDQRDWQNEMRGTSFRRAVSGLVIGAMKSRNFSLYQGSDTRYEEKRHTLDRVPTSF